MHILLVDDHKLFREGMRYVLEEGLENEGSSEKLVIYEASDSDTAQECIKNNPQIDLVLLDLKIPGNDGMSTLKSVVSHFPLIPVVILSASQSRTDIKAALDNGAMGFIHKDSSSSAVINAIRLVLSGNIYLPPVFLQEGSLNGAGKDAGLTERQIDVISLMAKGMSNKEIAGDLELAEATVKMHITNIMRTLEVTNRTQAVLKAEKLGLVETG